MRGGVWGVGLLLVLVGVSTSVSALAQESPQAPPADAAAASERPVFRVTVVEASPLPGLDLQPVVLPVPVQTATARALSANGALDLSAFMNRQVGSVHVNDTQGNAFQPDLTFRGYSASPLLGAPQGLSVYLDGVRLNQPFGEIVSWDLIPRVAIQTATVLPGANPLFGLNTLGGAVALHTKDGRTSAGSSLQATFGSAARRAVEFEHGGRRASGLHWYLAGHVFADEGWRDDSPSDVRQVFGKVGRGGAWGDLALTVSHANNELVGNGLQEFRLLDADRRSIYTKPDVTRNRSTLVNLTGMRRVSDWLTWSGNLYYRHLRGSTLNGDINDDALDQAVYQPNATERAALAAAGYTGVPTTGESAANTPFPSWRCIANVLLQEEPAETCNGLINRSNTGQWTTGLATQVTMRHERDRRRNLFTLGGGFDVSGVEFDQSSELGYLGPDRGIVGLGVFADGENAGEEDGEPFDTRVDLTGHVRTLGLYASDTLSVADRWHFSASGRLNQTTIRNRDGILPGGGTGSLDGDHSYVRFNPAVGVTVTASPSVNVYASYGEGSRAPASIELGCADPEAPCKLPNAMASDPPLNQVVTRTIEGGARGVGGRPIDWHVGVFRSANSDDILFVASEQTGFGYFRNFGRTRRQGLELGLDATAGRVEFGATYTWMSATFESEEHVDGTGNSTNEEADSGIPGVEGTIEVEAGDEIPGIPRHLAKVFADVTVGPRASLRLNVVAASGAFARGNENNLHEPDGSYYLGPGRTGGYAVVTVGGRLQVSRRVDLVGEISNLLSQRYASVAQLGPTGITASGAFIARPFPAIDGEFPLVQSTFLGPGAPRAGWLGLRVAF